MSPVIHGLCSNCTRNPPIVRRLQVVPVRYEEDTHGCKEQSKKEDEWKCILGKLIQLASSGRTRRFKELAESLGAGFDLQQSGLEGTLVK